MGQRQAVTKKLATSYRRGSRSDKTRILDELVELTGWHRDWGIRSGGGKTAPVMCFKNDSSIDVAFLKASRRRAGVEPRTPPSPAGPDSTPTARR
jgi:hypothetical protein